MNHHQRLRHAAARGARIQIFCLNHAEWETIGDRGDRGFGPGEEPSWGADNIYRIHPDDDRLEYGLISTALRQLALHPNDINLSPLHMPSIQRAAMYMEDAYMHDDEIPQLVSNVVRRPHLAGMFRLLVAEVLADEGL